MYVRPRGKKGGTNPEQEQIWNGFKMYQILSKVFFVSDHRHRPDLTAARCPGAPLDRSTSCVVGAHTPNQLQVSRPLLIPSITTTSLPPYLYPPPLSHNQNFHLPVPSPPPPCPHIVFPLPKQIPLVQHSLSGPEM